MHKLIKLFVLLPLINIHLAAQTKPETIEFITKEMKSFESDSYRVKEVYFSEEGTVFNYITYLPGIGEDRLVMPLANVNVFMAKKVATDGHYYYSLMLETRGRTGKIQINGVDTLGTRLIVRGMSNKTRIQRLQLAFNHLKRLLSGADSKHFNIN